MLHFFQKLFTIVLGKAMGQREWQGGDTAQERKYLGQSLLCRFLCRNYI